MNKLSLESDIIIKEKKHQFLPKLTPSNVLLGSIIGFTYLFIFLNHQNLFTLPNVKTTFISYRTISSIHCILGFFAAYLYVKKHITLRTWSLLLSISAGYFIFDILRELFFDKHSIFKAITEIYVHHALVLAGFYFYLNKRSYLLGRGMLSEITNLFLNISWYLIKSKQLHTLFAKIIGFCLIVSFAITRVYNFTYIGYRLYSEKRDFLEFFIVYMPILIVNYYWFILILIKCISLLFP